MSGPFPRRSLVWLAALAAGSLGFGVAVLIVGPDSGEVASFGADAFSRSALGHRAFVSLLRAEGVAVFVSRHDSAGRAGASAVLVVAEPHLESAGSARARRMGVMLGSARTVLLVLPKWTGRESPAAPGWVGEVAPVPESVVANALLAAGVAAAVARPGHAGTERCRGTETGVAWTQAQLLSPTSEALRPLIACRGGLLLGEVQASPELRIVVLADPDVLSNHGLARGENARLALEIVERVRRPGQALVVDETLHGHERIPSLWRELFAFPLLPGVLQAALTLAALVWSGLGRFGAPLPAEAALAPGKGVLIENTASLLRSAGHSAYTLGRYFDATVQEVAGALHAPAAAPGGEPHGWLDAVGRRRRVSVDLGTLRGQVERVRRQEVEGAAAVVAAARRVHRWREEMLRGPERRPGG